MSFLYTEGIVYLKTKTKAKGKEKEEKKTTKKNGDVTKINKIYTLASALNG